MSTLDDYIFEEQVVEKGERQPEKVSEEVSRPTKAVEVVEGEQAAIKACPYCGAVMRWNKPLKMHPGAIYLYKAEGEWRALADIDHVYNKCLAGLVENLRRMVEIFMRLSRRGYTMRILGKAYDDDLHAIAKGDHGRHPYVEEVEGLKIHVYVGNIDIDYFERTHGYMDRVAKSVLEEVFSGLGQI